MTPPKRRRSHVDLEAFMQSSARWSLIYGLLCVPTLGATAGAAIDNAQKAARNARFDQALLRQVRVAPACEEIELVPFALSMAHKN